MSATASPPTTLSSSDLSRLSERLGLLLRIGVGISAVFLLAGLLFAVVSPPADPFSTHGLPGSRLSLSGIEAGGPAIWCVTLGLFVLVATPIGRVVLSVQTFLRRKEMDYVGVTLLVLLLLGVSVVVGAFL